MALVAQVYQIGQIVPKRRTFRLVDMVMGDLGGAFTKKAVGVLFDY